MDASLSFHAGGQRMGIALYGPRHERGQGESQLESPTHRRVQHNVSHHRCGGRPRQAYRSTALGRERNRRYQRTQADSRDVSRPCCPSPPRLIVREACGGAAPRAVRGSGAPGQAAPGQERAIVRLWPHDRRTGGTGDPTSRRGRSRVRCHRRCSRSLVCASH